MTKVEYKYANGITRELTVITSAYGDSQHKTISLVTAEAGAVIVSIDNAEFWAELHAKLPSIGSYTPSEAVIKSTYEHAVQKHMDALAVAAGYDDIKTAVTYAEEPAVTKFQQEGQAFRAWRSLCWAYCYEQLAAVQANQRPQPTVEELLGELPTLLLPAV